MLIHMYHPFSSNAMRSTERGAPERFLEPVIMPPLHSPSTSSLPATVENVERARLARDFVTLLVTDRVSVHTRIGIFQEVLKKHPLSNQELTEVLSHALEIAILSQNTKLERAILEMRKEGIAPAATFFQGLPESVDDYYPKLEQSPRVVAISKYLVFKLNALPPEIEIQRALFQEAVKVPRPVDVHKRGIDRVFRGRMLGYTTLGSGVQDISGMIRQQELPLVMERIDGWDVSTYGDSETSAIEGHESLARAKHLELELARELGFNPIDLHFNAKYSPRLGMVFLLDFGLWDKSRTPQTVSRLARFLSDLWKGR